VNDILTSENTLAAITFMLKWKSAVAHHTDCYHAQPVNFWRDCFPRGLAEGLLNKRPGDVVEQSFGPGEIVPAFDGSLDFKIKANQFCCNLDGLSIKPRQGRFYPKGFLRGVPKIFPQNMEPFRVISVTGNELFVSLNHSLAKEVLTVRAEIVNVMPKGVERGGSCTDWIEILTTGPGMQVRVAGKPTDFFSDDSFRREDEADDAIFYEKPRFVQHLDDRAISEISRLYGELLPQNGHVLDLMSSWTSHLPKGLSLASVTGVGMNLEELKRNERLTQYLVQDLNQNLTLPFSENTFDAVICTASVEYLTHPLEIFNELARVLRSDGICIMTFSNRWFPPKAIRIWQDLHEFERMGLVLEYFLLTERFKDLHTYSMRGLPRPSTDKYFGLQKYSDPVYAVWGKVNKD